MTYKIAHISDVHFESSDSAVSAQLTAALVRESPNLIVFTGDLVNQPHHVRKGKPWLIDLCAACKVNSETNLLVVPGNHDYRFWGNIGLIPITSLFFRKNFWAWRNRRVLIVRVSRSLDVTFFHIDSNPVVWGAARGKVGWWELRKLRASLQALPEADQLRVRNSLKIALVHHHPLPIPYGGPDTFLFLKDAQRLLQFLGEQKVDMVLHGHKHRAPYSMLSLGTGISSDRVIEILGAGAAVKKSDFDPRGHNFNLICIEPDGLRYVRQFFAPQQGPFTESRLVGFPSQSFDLAYQQTWKARGFRFQSIHWDMLIDDEGDRFNELSYAGFAVLEDSHDFSSSTLALAPPAYRVDTGHLSGVWVNNDKTDPGIYLKQNEETRTPTFIEFEVIFPRRPTEPEPARFAIQSWDLNACSLNLNEFRRKFPERKVEREWEQKRIRAAVDDFYWTIRFPPELKFQHPPEFEVRTPGADAGTPADSGRRHEWLTRVLQPNFHYSPELHTAVLSIHKPPGDFVYRVYWYPGGLPEPTSPKTRTTLEVEQLARHLITQARARRAGEPLPEKLILINRSLNTLGQFVANLIKGISEAAGSVSVEQLDVSLMVSDEGDPLPTLRVVAAIGLQGDSFWDFPLKEGDGNAGRAYKKHVFRCYDSDIPDPKRQTYVRVPGYPQHQLLYSIPLYHPQDNSLIYGVLNIGTFDPHQADLLRQLNTDEGNLWLIGMAQKYFLPRLLDIVYNRRSEVGGSR